MVEEGKEEDVGWGSLNCPPFKRGKEVLPAAGYNRQERGRWSRGLIGRCGDRGRGRSRGVGESGVGGFRLEF